MPNEKNCASCGDLVGGHRAARHLDHRADQVLDLDALRLHRLGGDAIDDRLLVAQLLHEADQRDHDLRHDLQPFLVQPAGRLDDRARLHLGDLGIGDAEADAAVAEHRVELVQLLDALQQLRFSSSSVPVLLAGLEPGDLDHQLFALGQELVQRRIDGPDGDRASRASPLKTP